MSILFILLILSFLVIIHELGHFLVAKKAGITVEEFGIGYPPRLFRLFTDKGGTEYTFNWLPFGGFVRLFGEDGPASVSKDERKNAFFSKSIPARMAVILAGAFVNFLFGALAFGVIYSQLGIPTQVDTVVVQGVEDGSPAQAAGLDAQDEIIGVFENGAVNRFETIESFVAYLQERAGETVTLVVLEADTQAEESVSVYVRTEAELEENQGAIGVAISDIKMQQYPWWQMPLRGMAVGLESAIEFGGVLLVALYEMVRNLVFAGVIPQDVSGPIGIADAAQSQGLHETGLLGLLNFAAILSVNLAIVNVLPIPALDGGRALFLLLEGVIGRRLPVRLEQNANILGYLLLLTLIALISIRDIWRIFAR